MRTQFSSVEFYSKTSQYHLCSLVCEYCASDALDIKSHGRLCVVCARVCECVNVCMCALVCIMHYVISIISIASANYLFCKREQWRKCFRRYHACSLMSLPTTFPPPSSPRL